MRSILIFDFDRIVLSFMALYLEKAATTTIGASMLSAKHIGSDHRMRPQNLVGEMSTLGRKLHLRRLAKDLRLKSSRVKQFRGLELERSRNAKQVQERHIALAPFDLAHVRSIDV